MSQHRGTIFEQAQSSVREPSGPQLVSGFVPTQATRSPVAAAIQGAGVVAETVRDAQNKGTVSDLRAEIDQGAEDFKAGPEGRDSFDIENNIAQVTKAFQEGGISEDEANALDGMNQVLTKAKTAFKNKRISNTEFRIKMESILKRYVVENPGIARELRQATAGILGFDPTGSEIQAIFALENTKKQEKDALEQGLVKAINATNYWDPKLSSEENIQTNGPKAMDILRREGIRTREYEARKQMNALDKISQNKIANQETGYLLMTRIFPSLQGILTDETILSNGEAVPNNRAMKIQRIGDIRSQIGAQYRKNYPDMSSAELDTVLNPIYKALDQALTVADGSQNLAGLTVRRDTALMTIEAEVSGTEQGARMMVVGKLAKGVFSVPPSVIGNFGDFLKNDVAKITAKALSTNGDTSPFAASRDMGIKDAEAFNGLISSKLNDIVSQADPKDPEQMKQFENLIKGTMVPMFSSPESTRAIEFDTLVQVASNPKFAEMVQTLDPVVKSNLSKVTARYRTAIIQKMGEEVFNNYDPESESQFSFKAAVLGPDGDKLVQVQRDSSTGEFFFTAKPGMSPKQTASGERFAAGYNSRYASRLNDSVKIAAHLKGHTNYKGLIDAYLQSAPELLPFLAQVKEPDPIVVELQ